MIPIARPVFGPEEEAAVIRVLRSGIVVQGPTVQAFEEAFAAATGARFAVATSNGTTALQLALLAHGIGPGDEVITSPLTFIATANAIMHTGAKPVFADVDDSLNLSPDAVRPLIGPRTRAIMPVHLHGCPADLGGLGELADRYHLTLIQDACQAVGAKLDGQPLGAFGTAAYSLYATKNITTGEGGMITTDDHFVARKASALRHQAYSDQPYVHDQVGFNFRMTEVQAAIGIVQLGRLQEISERRRANAAYYDATIRGDLFPRPWRTVGSEPVFHQYVLHAAPPLRREHVRARLTTAGIGSAVHYPVPVHLQPAYRDFSGASCPRAEAAAREIFSIPVHPALSRRDLEAVADVLNQVEPAAAPPAA